MANIGRTIVIGVGNPILSDDGVGVQVVRGLREPGMLPENVDLLEVCSGGLDLMEMMVGYDRALIVDAMVTGKERPGTIYDFPLSDLLETLNSTSTHDATLSQAMELGRMLELKLPEDIAVIGIEADDVITFGEQLTPAVEQAKYQVIKKIQMELRIGGCDS